METPTELLTDHGFSKEAIQHIVNQNNIVNWEWKPING
jgi:hypothetical protein